MFKDATISEVSDAMHRSNTAFKLYKKYSIKERALLMRSIAQEIEALGDVLIETTMRETNLPEARLKGERGRTIYQLNSYADACEKGDWLEARICLPMPDKTPPRPDIRKMLNTLQMSVNGDEIVVDKSILVSNSYKNKVLTELCKPTSKSFNNIRQIIADSNVSDFEDMFRFLYDNVEKYAPLSVGEVVIYIEEYQYHANFRIDKEINIMALISRILSLILSKRVI